jgi:hypothetical protein
MTSDVPAGPDELTAAWLSEALGRPVAIAGVERIGEETGFLGVVARVDLDDGTALVAKFPTPDAAGRAVGRMLNVWAREAAFYADLAPSLGDTVPRCLHSAADTAADRWCLLLEDLGGSEADQVTGATPDQARRAVETLAAVHRRFGAGARPAPWLPGFDRPGFGALQDAMREAVPGFVAAYRGRVPAETLGWLTRFVEHLPEWAETQGGGPLTLVHADFRLDNLIVTADRVRVVDWQTALWGPGPMDLASFLATSVTIEARRAVEAELLAAYAAGTGTQVGDVDRSYRSSLCWWMAIFANNLSRIDPGAGRATALFDQTILRTFTAAADRDAGALLP